MKKCPFCGEQTTENANFCMNCLKVLNTKNVLKASKITSRLLKISVCAGLATVLLTAGTLGILSQLKTPPDEVEQEYVQNNAYITYTTENGKQKIIAVNNDGEGDDGSKSSQENGAFNSNSSDNDVASPDNESANNQSESIIYSNNSDNKTNTDQTIPTDDNSLNTNDLATDTENNVIGLKYVSQDMQTAADAVSLVQAATPYFSMSISTPNIINKTVYYPDYLEPGVYNIFLSYLTENTITDYAVGVSNSVGDFNGIERVVLPPNFEHIQTNAFHNFYNLKDIYIMSETLYFGWNGIFYTEGNVTIHCLPECVDMINSEIRTKRVTGVAAVVEWDGNIDNIG